MSGRASLGRRLLLSSVLAVSLVLVTFGLALYLLVRSALYQLLDHTLLEQAQRVAELVEYDLDGIDLDLDRLDGQEYGPQRSHAFYTLWDEHGTVLARSPSLQGGVLPRFGASRTPEIRAGALPDGRVMHLAGMIFVPNTEDGAPATTPPMQLVVARDVRPVQQALQRLAWLLAALWAAAGLAAVVVLRWVVRRGLSPAVALAEHIGRIDPAATTRPIDLPGAPSELVPVVQRLNDLLARIDAAMAREKSFLGAAAHELRTPLAGLRAALEVTLGRPRTEQAYREALSKCAELSEAMQARIDALMYLARLDAGQVSTRSETVALRNLVERAFEPLQERASRRGLSLRIRLSPQDAVLADADKLRMVLDNVLDNAVSHAGAEGEIEVTSSIERGTVELSVTSPGCRLSAAALSQVFDRFFRVDAVRPVDDGHLGLGLSLCKELVTRMGGAIRASASEGRFRLMLTLPSTEKAPS